MKELGTENPKSQNNAPEVEQMSLVGSFATLFGSSLTLSEKRRTKGKTPQRTSW